MNGLSASPRGGSNTASVCRVVPSNLFDEIPGALSHLPNLQFGGTVNPLIEEASSNIMSSEISLEPRLRKALLKQYRSDYDPAVRFRAHIVLLLAEGYSWGDIASILFCSTRTISRWKQRYEQEGIAGLEGLPRARRFHEETEASLVMSEDC